MPGMAAISNVGAQRIGKDGSVTLRCSMLTKIIHLVVSIGEAIWAMAYDF